MPESGILQIIAGLFSRLAELIVSSIVGDGGTGLLNVIVGNAASAGAMVTDSLSGVAKTQKKILIMQTLSQVFYIASSMVLRAYSATVQNAVAVARNIVAMRGKSSKTVEFILIAAPVILGIFLNNRGVVGLLPVMANLEYSIAVFRYAAQPVKLKLAFVVCNVMYCVFNFAVLNFVGGISAVIIIITTSISVIREKKRA